MGFSFKEADRAFKDDKIKDLANDEEGLRFLKLRSLSRSSYLRELKEKYNIETETNYAKDLLENIYDSDVSSEAIENYIRECYKISRKKREKNEEKLVSELYNIKSFDWGGLHQNSLERTIVNNYVKKIKSYEVLSSKIENELHNSLKSYVLSSWYNHWSSIIIEDTFKDHESVLPAIGLIKKIDFFISNVPFDLKVTYLPEGFIKDIRKEKGLGNELTLLKALARDLDIHYDRKSPNSKLLEDLWHQISDHPSEKAKKLIKEIKSERLDILDTCIEDSESLIRWLYENQGVRRFDSSNRLFLILVDCSNFFDSWKLKRAKPLLVDKIHSHLDNIADDPGKKIKFDWEGEEYSTRSDAIIIAHNRD